ncbi:hypothetical protein [Alkaliphilus serpentinus]|uniref:Uncharacterized protein n=1 Tax=Alkaliphilus serpentinus TaxID=1482731 RepID=A0A833ME44_9FIRM|nr:hypothetical protein [Alkaliphilus serpentinus]KAB3530257.1 hypothetical protein F8153_07510 [Alkaliphilus serpentinus]
MTTLQAVIRLKEIKETIENYKIPSDLLVNIQQEFLSLKSQLLSSSFAFEGVIGLIDEVEAKLNKAKIIH